MGHGGALCTAMHQIARFIRARAPHRENKKGARVDRCAKGRAAVTVRVYDPDTPSFVIEHKDAGLN